MSLLHDVTLANILRLLAISEIAFSLGFLAIHIWRRHATTSYLSLMGFALAIYSVFAAIILLLRYNQPLSWRTPTVFVAATISIIAVVREGRTK